MGKKQDYPAIAITEEELKREANQLTKMLKGKSLLKIWRHRSNEIVVEFSDGSRLFVDAHKEGIETSVT